MEIIDLDKTIRPNRHRERNIWNASWEKDIKKAYDIAENQLPHLTMVGKPEHFPKQMNGTIDIYLERYKTDILNLQIESRRKTITRLATDDFAEKWTGLLPRERQQHILEAIYTASSAGVDFEARRKWCPELTVKGLGEKPQSFFDLLMVLVLGDDGEITHFPNPLVESLWSLLGSRADPLLIAQMKLDRTFFITMVLWRLYLAFHNLPDELYRFEEIGSADKQLRSTLLNDKERKTYEQVRRKLKAAEAGERNRCWGCGKPEALLPSETVFQVCGGCRKINRKILYCSRECQKEDWKTSKGHFLRHKDICGKPIPERDPQYMDVDPPQYLSESNAVLKELLEKVPINIAAEPQTTKENREIQSAANSNIRKAKSGTQVSRDTVKFKTSPSLLYQKRLLKGNDPPDYNLVMQHPESDLGIRIPDPRLRVEFLRARAQAMSDNSVMAVRRMYQILQPFAEHFAPKISSTYDLKKQLKKEYGVDL
ncbi:hypothetical protein CPB83DRAFT_848663 [Crepidotus variabilis]|uniref:MYND-type domain-containing protein n=1 Tax=Crepidotus variabilis TaxID=179855 RepID=A0A9P6JTB5_9AGAR|nr:hypothetical protein CPB83DRAFT_848663 [Crepidotus variabilis]